MNKSILVIDTPENCLKCEFSVERLCGNGRCSLNKDSGNVIPDRGKPDWCPLKELPEKKKPRKVKDDINLRHYYVPGFDKGYNKCIDDILNETY